MATKLQGNLALVETGAIAAVYAGLDGNIYMDSAYCSLLSCSLLTVTQDSSITS